MHIPKEKTCSKQVDGRQQYGVMQRGKTLSNVIRSGKTLSNVIRFALLFSNGDVDTILV
jgi:hypothetical protein